jgi:putative oxidoreductase
VSELRTAPSGVLRAGVELSRTLDRLPLSLFQLLARVSVGAVFWSAGLTKIASWQITLALFRNEYAVPLLPPPAAAVLATAIELLCPILLVLGLGTRLAVLPMLAQVLVIEVFVYPQDWIQHLGWATPLLLLLGRGPGALSIDHLLKTRVDRVREVIHLACCRY